MSSISISQPTNQTVILASASATRLGLLRKAAVAVEAEAASLDEAALKASFRAAGMSAAATALALAELKAVKISARHPQALVIGADQMLECRGVWLDKPKDMAAAHHQLERLSGCTHHLFSAVVVAIDAVAIWHHSDKATLMMRATSPQFREAYLELSGNAALDSVGAYQLEAAGVQLFQHIEGDFFTIMGLPLLPLLAFLRDRGVLAR